MPLNIFRFYVLLFLISINIQLDAQVAASFNADFTVGCSPLIVNFNNTSQNANQYSWDFGNGSQSSLVNPSTTYTVPGFYTVKLIAQNGADIDSLIQTNYIQVLDLPNSDFTYSISTNCEADNLLSFSNNSIGAVSYVWDFGDGNISSDFEPTHHYQLAGDYYIKLIATNSSNCSDNMTIGPISIHPTPLITASSDTLLACDSTYQFNFIGASSNSTINDWSWDFGNGTVTNGNATINYSYNSTGSFVPKLTVTSANGCVDSITLNTVTIHSFENYSISSDQNTGCPPLLVNFEILPNSNIQQVNWDYGDTNSSLGSNISSNTYLNPGNYNASGTITDINGCVQQINLNNTISVDLVPTATYGATNTNGCPPLDVQFNLNTDPSNVISWDFGDTTFSNSTNPLHTYQYNGTFYPEVTLTSPNGCQSIFNVDTIQAGLTLTNFMANPSSGCAALEVDFTNTAPQSATSFFWDFGDGNTSTNPNPTHIYDTIGEYTVIFSCSDNSGCTSNYTINNMITTYGEDDVVLPETDTIFACSPYTYQADASNIGETYWNWDFGDGAFSTNSSTSHTYNTPGQYIVKLNTDAPNGCMYNLTDYAVVNVDNLDVSLNITVDPDCSVGTLDVVNNSIGVVQHQWNSGDGTTYTTPNIQHTYVTSESYVVTYQAVSDIGCIINRFIPVIFSCGIDTTIVAPPLPMPEQDPITILIDPNTNAPIDQSCGPTSVNLSSPYSNAISFLWDFGDGTNSTEQNPYHYYGTAGTFNLTHYATYANGNIDSFAIDGFIDQYIFDATIDLTKTALCNESKYDFNNNTSGVTSWEWFLDSVLISTQSSDDITLALDDSVKVLSLKISDQYGCENNSSTNLYLYNPLVLIEQDTFACVSNNAIFECSVIGDPIHTWDLDDGTIISPDTAVIHTYNQNGIYEVVLSLDDNGCVRQIVLDSIEVYGPDASFSPLAIAPICHTDSILFEATNSSYTTYNWSGASLINAGDSAWLQFNSPGPQVVSLSITDNGCSQQIGSDTIIVNKADAAFNYTQMNGCLPIDVNFADSSQNPINWIWNFGDGNISNAQNPSHQYTTMPTDSVQLIITDINGCKDSISSVIINELNADFLADDTLVCINSPVIFSGLDDVVNNWLWDFGDGNTSTDSIPTHYYQSSGQFQVKLIVSDGQGCNDTVIKSDYIEVQEVIADFSYSAPGNCPPILTTFTNNSIGASSYVWDFGDSVSSVVPSPSHVYNFSDIYYVTLIATNSVGCKDTFVHPDSLAIPGPQLNYSVDELMGCDSLTIVISDSSINTVDYNFDFGDGTVSLLANPTHTYSSPGAFQITLVGEDPSGCQAFLTYTDTIYVYPTPTINVAILDSNVCFNNSSSPINTTVNADTHLWTYGTQSYTIDSPTILVDLAGSNELKYVATNSSGNCKDSTSINLVGHQIPDVAIIDQGILCSNQQPVNFSSLNNNSLGTIIWSGIGITDSLSGLFNPSQITDSTTIYAFHDSICTSQDSLTIIIDNPPDATIITNDTLICYGQIIPSPIVLNSGGVWSGTSVDPVTGTITDTLSLGTYLYYYQLNNSNCSDTNSYQIEILYQNDASILDPGIICDNSDTLTLISADTGGVWSGSSINSTSGLVDINILGNGVYDFIYSISGQCPASDTFTLEIFEFTQAQINPSVSYCEGTDSIQFTATSTLGTWSGLLNTHVGNGMFNTDSVPDGIHEVYYTITGNCPDADTLILTILPKPDIAINLIQQLPCIGYPLSIENNSQNLVDEDYSWYVNDSLYYQNFNDPYFTFEPGFYELKTIAVNQYNCETVYIFPDSIPIYDTATLQTPQVIRSTVFENSSVFTEWEGYSLTLNPINEYLLYRAINNDTMQYLITLDSSTHHYLDENVDVFNNEYKYKIIAKNMCEVNSNLSNQGNSILLNYQRPDNYQTKLIWNFYNEWLDGVNRYEIQKLNANGQWETITTTDNLNNQIIIDE